MRSTGWAIAAYWIGAASQIWTGDLILTKDALYRLSYSSILAPTWGTIWNRRTWCFKWRLGGEISEGVSKQSFNCCCLKWRLGRDLNPRPPAWQAGVLTNWTTEPFETNIYKTESLCGFSGRGRRNRTLIRGFGDRYSTVELCPWTIKYRPISAAMPPMICAKIPQPYKKSSGKIIVIKKNLCK